MLVCEQVDIIKVNGKSNVVNYGGILQRGVMR